GSVDEGRIETQGGEIVGEIEEFPAGETETATFGLTAGEYVLFCNVPGHYGLGIHTKLTVQ
ncbi:MAG TPA: plastocyanin/azurin family copper-binding protein, partial [Gemmatimonadales bacterium]|nr:plastocyanin/azurin family copper-binding protein [Gemmatimonadales bacterium]